MSFINRDSKYEQSGAMASLKLDENEPKLLDEALARYPAGYRDDDIKSQLLTRLRALLTHVEKQNRAAKSAVKQ